MLHLSTKNNSFLKMYEILNLLGLKNNDFFLQLNDPTIADLDYFDENSLTIEQKIRILKEVHDNIWFFLREIVLIPAAGGNISFNLNRGTLALIWSLVNNISNITILPRQTGKTFAICAFYLWLFYFGAKNTAMTLFSYNDNILQASLQRIKDIRENLPKYLNLLTTKDKDNSREMRFNTDSYFNHIRIKAPSLSLDGAMRAGRGLSTSCVFMDELAFTPNIKEIYESSVFAYKTAAEAAKKQNNYYHRVMTSSAGTLNSNEGKWAFDFINSSCEFNEKMYDLDINNVKEIISKNSINNFLYITFMYYDLSLGDEYLESAKKDSVSEDAFRREVLNSWEKTGVNHPLGQDLVNNLTNYIKKPVDILIIDNVYFLKLFRPIAELNFDMVCVGGVDCGGNLMKDYSTLVIVDPGNFEVVATLRTNSFSTNRFAKALVYIMLRIFPGLILVPERNSMGIAIIDFIIDNFPQLYRRIYHQPNEGNNKKDLVTKKGEKPGFATTSVTRPLLFNNLLKIVVQEDYYKLHDANIIYEIIGLIVTRNGKVDHDPSGHDDTLIAYLFVRWFFTYAKNISRYIDIRLIGTEVISEEIVMNKEIEELSKKKSMNNYKRLLFDDPNVNTIDEDGVFNENTLNPLTMMRDIDIRRENSVADVEGLYDVLNNRLKTRDILTERNLQTLDPTLLPDEESVYEQKPDTVAKAINKDDIKTESMVQSTKNPDDKNYKIQLRSILGL
jgi:hypothetical protein